MSGYAFQVVKCVHILAAMLFIGFGLASFFYKALAFRSGSAAVTLFCDQQVVLADWMFTVPSGLVIPLTGAIMVQTYDLPWTTGWVLTGLVGFTVAGVMWLPAARLQIKMRRLAEAAVLKGEPLPTAYGVLLRTWAMLGIPSFVGAMLALWAMVAKWSP